LKCKVLQHKPRGLRQRGGRKPKATELKIIEKLTPLETMAFEALAEGLKSGDFSYVKLFMEYRFGKPKDIMESSGSSNDDKTWKVIYVDREG
jgi:hypothetical protein